MDPDAQTHKEEASIIKASVGPGERRSLFQTPELPHWYHSVQFCSCNSIVCPRDQSGLATLIITQTHSREDDQYCNVLLPFDHVFTVMLYFITLFKNTADREKVNSRIHFSERKGS